MVKKQTKHYRTTSIFTLGSASPIRKVPTFHQRLQNKITAWFAWLTKKIPPIEPSFHV